MAQTAMNEHDVPAPFPGREDDGRDPDLFAAGAAIRSFAKDHGMTATWHSGNVVDQSGYFFPTSTWLLDWWSDGLLRRLQIDFDRGVVVYSSAWKFDERSRLLRGPSEFPRRAYALSPPVDEEMVASTLALAEEDALWFTKETLQEIKRVTTA